MLSVSTVTVAVQLILCDFQLYKGIRVSDYGHYGEISLLILRGLRGHEKHFGQSIKSEKKTTLNLCFTHFLFVLL